MIYLDNAATSFPKPVEVAAAVQSWFSDFGVDAARGSSERHEQVALRVAECRKELAALTGVIPSRVALCSGATEALNTCLKGRLRPGQRVWTTMLEHNAVIRPLVRLRDELGLEVEIFHPTTTRVEAEQIREALQAGPAPDLFVFSHASNVTGVVHDFTSVIPDLRAAGTSIVVDCAQSAGRLDLGRIDADAWIVPGHKGLYGPPGIGALCLREGFDVPPLRDGGTGSSVALDRMPAQMPSVLEGGTPNTPGIFGLLAGMQWVRAQDGIHEREMQLARALRERLAEVAAIELFGAEDPETHVAVLSLTVQHLDPSEVAVVLENCDVCVRAGFHCAPYTHECLGTSDGGTVRLSIGAFNTLAEIETVAGILREL